MNDIATIKKGYKTFEFWLSVLLSLGSVVTALAGYIPAKAALIATVVIGCLYNLIRAVQNAAVPGVANWYESTRFWIGILSIVMTALMAIRDGGISAPWIGASIAVITAVMGAAQAIGAQQPEQPSPNPVLPPK